MNAAMPTGQNAFERIVRGLLGLALLAGVVSALSGGAMAPLPGFHQLLG